MQVLTCIMYAFKALIGLYFYLTFLDNMILGYITTIYKINYIFCNGGL